MVPPLAALWVVEGSRQRLKEVLQQPLMFDDDDGDSSSIDDYDF